MGRKHLGGREFFKIAFINVMMVHILYLLCNFILLTSEDIDKHNISNARFRPAGTRPDKQNTLCVFNSFGRDYGSLS